MLARRADRIAKAAQVRARAIKMRKRGKPRLTVRPQYPAGVEQSYAQALRKILAVARALVLERVMPKIDDILAASRNLTKADSVARADDYAQIIADLFGDVRIEFERRTKKSIGSAAETAAERAADFNKKDQQRVFKSMLGVDVLGNEPWLSDFVDLFTESNVGLIKSIPQKYFSEIESMVREAALSGTRPESLASDFEERFGVSESRAKFLARDQIGKFNGELTRVRQGRLGVVSFVWRTSLDERVRPSHAAKEGQSYQWDDPPADTGVPGADYQCRCTAEPNIEDLADDPSGEPE